jgi:hypothetical protein
MSQAGDQRQVEAVRALLAALYNCTHVQEDKDKFCDECLSAVWDKLKPMAAREDGQQVKRGKQQLAFLQQLMGTDSTEYRVEPFRTAADNGLTVRRWFAVARDAHVHMQSDQGDGPEMPDINLEDLKLSDEETGLTRTAVSASFATPLAALRLFTEACRVVEKADSRSIWLVVSLSGREDR